MITMGSALKLLTAMHVSANSRFLDLGSGHGMVCLAASLAFGAAATGIEMHEQRHAWAEQKRREIGIAGLAFVCGDICHLKTLENATHVYSFDRDFPPALLQHMAGLLKSSWRVFASSRPSGCWRSICGAWWDKHVLPAEPSSVSIRLCGSGKTHTIYVFRRR